MWSRGGGYGSGGGGKRGYDIACESCEEYLFTCKLNNCILLLILILVLNLIISFSFELKYIKKT